MDSYGGYRVQPFEGDQWDEELLEVPEAVEAAGADPPVPLAVTGDTGRGPVRPRLFSRNKATRVVGISYQQL